MARAVEWGGGPVFRLWCVRACSSRWSGDGVAAANERSIDAPSPSWTAPLARLRHRITPLYVFAVVIVCLAAVYVCARGRWSGDGAADPRISPRLARREAESWAAAVRRSCWEGGRFGDEGSAARGVGAGGRGGVLDRSLGGSGREW